MKIVRTLLLPYLHTCIITHILDSYNHRIWGARSGSFSKTAGGISASGFAQVEFGGTGRDPTGQTGKAARAGKPVLEVL